MLPIWTISMQKVNKIAMPIKLMGDAMAAAVVVMVAAGETVADVAEAVAEAVVIGYLPVHGQHYHLKKRNDNAMLNTVPTRVSWVPI